MDVRLPEQGVLPAAERVVGHRHRDGDVDADHPDVDAALEPPRGLAGAGEDRGAVAVGVGVDDRDGLVHGAGTDHRQHRAEDLLRVDVHRRGDVVDHGRAHEEAVLVAGHREPAAVDGEGGALGRAGADQVDDPVARSGSDHRAHLAVGVAAGADLRGQGLRADGLDERVGGRPDGHGRGDRHAALARRAERGGDEVVGGVVDAGVGQDDRVVLRAAQGLHALAGRGAALVDVLRDGRGADERHGGHVRVLQQRVDRLLVAVHHVEHAVGQAGLGPQLRGQHRRARVALAGLEHERVAGGDGHRVHPHRHHGREVERRDARAHAQRLAEREQVHPSGDLVGVLALEQRRDAARELDDLQSALHLALRVREHLAVLVGDDLREVADAGVDQLAEREQHLHPLRQRRLAPRLERGRRGAHRRSDVGCARQQHFRLLCPGGRVPHRAGAGALARDRFAADPVRDGPQESVLPIKGRCVVLCAS